MSLTLDITITSSAVERRLAQLTPRAEAAQRDVLRRFGDDVVSVLISRTPVGEAPAKGKRLWQNYQQARRDVGGGHEVRITNPTPYLRWVLRGRGPVVARGRALRFVIGGRVIYRKRVGPARANPYHRPVIAQAKAMAGDVAREIAQQIVRP